MKIAIGTDHRGLFYKNELKEFLEKEGHEVIDKGSFSEESVDYTDFAHIVAAAVASGEVERGVLMCGTGIGVSMAANKAKSVRAALCHNEQTSIYSRLHNDANIICLGVDIVAIKDAKKMLTWWFSTEFEGGRHQRRIDKIDYLTE